MTLHLKNPEKDVYKHRPEGPTRWEYPTFCGLYVPWHNIVKFLYKTTALDLHLCEECVLLDFAYEASNEFTNNAHKRS